MEIALQTMRGVDESIELAQWAESAGLAAFSVADHYLARATAPGARDQLTVLAAVAAATQTIPLSTLVSPITFRHPAAMLMTAITLDEISKGRFSLGVGAGWMEDEHTRFGLDFPPVGERFDRMTEALGYLRTAIDGDEGGFSGDYYSFAPGPPLEPRGEALGLIVGGGGPRRIPNLAGTYADEYNVVPAGHPLPDLISRARAAAADAGRDPETLLVSIAFPMVVGADEAEIDERIQQVAVRRATSAEAIRDRWKELEIPVGTVDEYLSKLADLEAQGVQRVYLQVSPDPIDDIRHGVGLLR